MKQSFFILSIIFAASLVGCSSWDRSTLKTPPGGAGISRHGVWEEGPKAVAAISSAPSRNRIGVVQPFGSQGETAAYEFWDGYRVGAGDRLLVKVLDQPDLTGEYLIESSGDISLPLLRRVNAAGLTTSEIERLLTDRLRARFLRNPSVSVQLVSSRPFYILGQVNQAGGFPYQTGMTVQNAIALAGGYSPRANQGKVLLTRKTARGTKTYEVPVTTYLYPGDTLYVQERWF